MTRVHYRGRIQKKENLPPFALLEIEFESLREIMVDNQNLEQFIERMEQSVQNFLADNMARMMNEFFEKRMANMVPNVGNVDASARPLK